MKIILSVHFLNLRFVVTCIVILNYFKGTHLDFFSFFSFFYQSCFYGILHLWQRILIFQLEHWGNVFFLRVQSLRNTRLSKYKLCYPACAHLCSLKSELLPKLFLATWISSPSYTLLFTYWFPDPPNPSHLLAWPHSSTPSSNAVSSVRLSRELA